MTIDSSKLQPGDTVSLVPLEVLEVLVDDDMVNVAFGPDGLVEMFMIAAHHPAPREFQVGDRVTSNGKADVGTIEHVARGKARVIWDDTWDVIMPLEILTLVEDGE